MTLISLTFCLFIASLGGLGVVSPSRFLAIVRRVATLERFYTIAILRIAFGAVLYLAAATSRAPALLQIIGVVAVVAGIFTPFFGHARYRKVVAWWSAGGTVYIRIWAACTMVFGLLLAYVVFPPGAAGIQG